VEIEGLVDSAIAARADLVKQAIAIVERGRRERVIRERERRMASETEISIVSISGATMCTIHHIQPL
jgi:hypothetical protein